MTRAQRSPSPAPISAPNTSLRMPVIKGPRPRPMKFSTRNRTLDYLYVFDNVPLQFIYRNRLNPGELSELEQRNKTITETLWIDSYHQELVCNVIYRYFYRGGVLQMPFQIHQIGAGVFSPPEKEATNCFTLSSRKSKPPR